MIQNDQFITNSLRGLVVDLQEKCDAATPQGMIFSALSSGDLSPQTSDRQTSGLRPPQNNPSSRSRARDCKERNRKS